MKAAWHNWGPTVFNIIGFQIVWLACVWGAAKGTWQFGLLLACLFATVSFWLSKARRRDVQTLLIALPVGFVMDSLLAQWGILQFASPFPFTHWAPAWIMALWLGFSLTLNHSLQTIYQNRWWTFLFGFLGGPLAYGIAAWRFDAMQLQTEPLIGSVAVALVWGFGLSLIRTLDNRLTTYRGSAV